MPVHPDIMTEICRWIIHYKTCSVAIIANKPCNLPMRTAYPSKMRELEEAALRNQKRVAQSILLQNSDPAHPEYLRGMFRLTCRFCREKGINWLYSLVNPASAMEYANYAQILSSWGQANWDFADGLPVIAIRVDIDELFERYLTRKVG